MKRIVITIAGLAIAGLSVAACGSSASSPAVRSTVTVTAAPASAATSAPVPASSPGGYTDMQDCQMLSTDYSTFNNNQNTATLAAFQADLAADSSGSTDSPTLAAATAALDNDVTYAVDNNGATPSTGTADEQAVVSACAAAGVTLPASFVGSGT
jgi:hypothetical protein